MNCYVKQTVNAGVAQVFRISILGSRDISDFFQHRNHRTVNLCTLYMMTVDWREAQ